MDQREVSIMAQVALKSAVQVVSSGLFTVESPEDVAGATAELASAFFDVMTSIVGGAAVSEAFPGTTVAQPAPLTAIQPAPAQAAVYGPQAGSAVPNVAPLALVPQPAAAAPAAIPQAGYGRADVVAMFMADPSQFEDKRAGKRSDKSPDFIHRNLLDPKNPKYHVSLYLNWDESAVIRQTYGI